MSKAIIFTSYFTSKKHPQHIDPTCVGIGEDGKVANNHFHYIKDFHASVNLKENVKVVIFHDGLSDKFVEEYSTQNICFYKVNGNYSEYSLNDSRFMYYYDFARMYSKGLEDYDLICMTDASDVVMVKDVTTMLSNFKDQVLMVGDEPKVLAEYISCNGKSFVDLSLLYRWETHDIDTSSSLINAGVICGQRFEIFRLLNFFKRERLRLEFDKSNINMPLMNYLIRNFYGDGEIVIGSPITSTYKKFQTERKNVYFRHK